MSSPFSPRSSSKAFRSVLWTSAFSALLVGVGSYGIAHASPLGADVDQRLVPPVQNYAEQAVPVVGKGRYDSPLAAGTLTLEDVLEAHKPNPQASGLPAPVTAAPPPVGATTAPVLLPAQQESSTSLMMSQGMRSILQKVGETSIVSPTQMRAPSMKGPAATQAEGQPASLLQGTTNPAASAVTVDVPLAPGIKFESGQEPKNLGGLPSAAPAASTAATSTSASVAPLASSSSSPTQSCDKDVQKWEKSCGDAGYPATYIGKIIGETHSGCADGALHDVWVSNTCAPPNAATSQSPSTAGACGPASNNQFDDAPTSNLCAQGIASAVSGSGPWNWACSGVNGGQPAACVASTRITAVNAVCGSANGVAVNSAPSGDLCGSGTATAVSGTGPWTWSCRGVGMGSSQSCIAPVAKIVHAAPAVVAENEAPAPALQPVVPVTRHAASVATPVAPVSGENGELCGTAAETLAYEAPDKGLCRAGSASVVNGDGPWTWSCTDNEGGHSSCRTLSLNGDAVVEAPATAVESAPTKVEAEKEAPRHVLIPPAPREESVTTAGTALACGAAAIEPAVQEPTDNLCVNGKAGPVKGSGPWHWTCASANKNHHKISCETTKMLDGRCGPANGSALKSTPFAGLCAAGVPTGITGTGPWSWTCEGSGSGVSATCAASLQADTQTSVDGTCGAAANAAFPNAPVEELCASGSPSAVSGKGPWNWSCSGSNGGAVTTCAANKITATKAPGPVVNGLCGEANGLTTAVQPANGLCASGTVASVVGNGPWNWSCLGQNGGMTVSCTAPLEPPAPIDGVCGGASGVSTLVRPQSGLCASGITGTVSGHGPWTWTCSGANGGSPSSCVAPVAGKSGSLPSLTTTALGDAESEAPLAAPSGLVTPQLPTSSHSSLPALDRKTIPSLTPSRGLRTPVLASPPPAPAALDSAQVPSVAPDIAADMQPVPPPAARSGLSPAPALQETATERASHIPGNHLTLDPTLSTVLFERGSGNIDEKVLTTLDRLSAVLDSNPDVRVTLTAYADNSGSTPRDARRLSLTRALAVREYLASKGIADSRVDVRAEGANTTSGYIDRVDVKVND